MSRLPLANFRSVPALLTFAVTAVVGLGLDLWSKRVAFDRLAPWGIETIDEPSPRAGMSQVVPRRSMSAGGWAALGVLRTGDGQAATGLSGAGGGAVIEQLSPFGPAVNESTILNGPATRLEAGDRVVAVNGTTVVDGRQGDAAVSAAIASLNDSFAKPASTTRWERADPPLAKGIDLTVVRQTRDAQERTFVVRVHPAETPIFHAFVPGYLNFQALVNQGAVFGIGQGQRFLFLIVSALAIGFILYLFAASKQQRLYQLVLGLLLAGVIGNMYDRLNLGFVRDMIHALPGRTWPGTQREIFPWIFNLADMWLCVGVGLIFLHTLRGSPAGKEKTAAEPANVTAGA